MNEICASQNDRNLGRITPQKLSWGFKGLINPTLESHASNLQLDPNTHNALQLWSSNKLTID